MVNLDVTRFRCPRCRATATALPEEALTGIAHDIDTVAGIIAFYLDSGAGYRELAWRVLGLERPPAITHQDFTLPPFPSPTPSTCFRWVARFAAGARAWWSIAMAALLARGDYVQSPPPATLAAKGKSDDKRALLRDAWYALDALRVLATQLDAPSTRWPHVMSQAPARPVGLDRTGWFVSVFRSRVPP